MNPMRTFLRTAAGLSLLLAPAAAHAGWQSGPASRFNGTYDLTCQQATWTLHFSLAGGTAAGSGSFNADVSATLPCEALSADDPAVVALANDVEGRCLAAGLPAAICTDLRGRTVTAALDTTGMVPRQAQLTAQNTWDWWNQLIGIYPAHGNHMFDNNAAIGWDYLLDNNDGPQNGHFAIAAINVLDGASVDHAGCLDVATGFIDGRINRTAGYALGATFGVDRSLTCLVVDDTAWLWGTIGITFRGAVDGARL
ncbi:MAG TPA: hypothetical protein VFA20_14405 [Myxococcaceae bacterium]|nr:hypothetical protein [Myxococcaceae bacterium]